MAKADGAQHRIVIGRETPDQPAVRDLLAASDRYHQALYPAESNHLVDVKTLMTPDVRFLVARGNAAVVGCGAVLIGADDGLKTGELKRMWVEPSARGTGLGRRLLEALESEAVGESVTVMRLETGISQPEALALYRNAGYVDRPPFAGYIEDPLSVFMEKRLG